jgi:hypothetical protein
MKKYPLFLLYICIICCGPKPHVSIERSSIGASSEFWYGNGQANIGDASYQQVARTRALNIIAEQLEVEIKSSIIDVQEQYGVGLGGKGNEYNKVTIESRVNTNLENIEYFNENKKKGVYYISARLNKEKYFDKIRKQVEQASAISLNHIKTASENELMEALSHYLQALESIEPFLDQYPEVNYQSQQKELYPLLVDLINTSNNNINISMINKDVSIKSIVDDSKILKIKCIDKSTGKPLSGIPIKIFWDMEDQNSSIITNSEGVANYEIKRIWSAAKNQIIKFQINYDDLYLKTVEHILRLDPKVFETNINIEGPKIFLSATVNNLGKVIDHKDLSATIKKYFVDLSSAEFVKSRSKADLELKYYINTEERSKRLNDNYPIFVYATGSLSIIRIENNEEIYSINLPESKGADFNQNIIAGKRAIKNLLKEIDDKGLLGLN